MATDRPFYDLARDASDATRQLADALRRTIEEVRKASEISDNEVRDAVRLVSLDWGG